MFADIDSANTVGYVSATIPAGGNKTFAVTLTDCANPGAAVRVDQLLASEDFYGNSFANADQIWRWDTTVNKWAKYFYERKGRPGQYTYAWKKYNYAESKVEDITGVDVVEPGETFIFTRAGAADSISLTLSGQVAEFTVTPAYQIPAGGNVFMAYPWPIEIKISALESLVAAETYAAFYGNSFANADQIWRWDASINKWAKYFYERKGRPGQYTYAWKKWNYAESKVEDLTNDDVVHAGEGFIFTRAGAAETLNFQWKALQAAE